MEKKISFDPQQALGDKITKFSRRELCEFGSALCRQIRQDAGAGNYRGGVFPENISMEEEGGIAIGQAKSEGWEGREADFIAPELFWHGQASPAADVYAVGMLLYYAASGGSLPFVEDGEEKARARRMSGERFDPPKGAGRRLGEIIAKATAFKTSDRYKSVGEIEAMLDSCVKNLYLSGAPSAELLFNKNDDDLSEVERMMVSIIEKGGEPDTHPAEESAGEPAEEPVKAAAEESAEEAAAEAGEETDAPEEPAGKEPVQEKAAPEETAPEEPVKAPDPPRQPVVQLFEEKNPELEPVVPKRPVTPAVQYGKSMERERKIAEKVKRRRARPFVFVMLLCALLIIVAIIVNAINSDREATQQPPAESPEASANVVVIPPEQLPTEESQAPVESEAPVEPEQPKESTYQLFIEDVSWTEARDRCIEKGGHLVVISDDAELQKVIDLANSNNVSILWIGCHRQDGALVWETDEQVSTYPWDTGEPSYMDSYDGVYEDYLMLWYHNGWVYNDSRNDPVADYPGAYSGKIAYVCEFEG